MSPKSYHLNIAEYPVISLAKIVADLLESITEKNDRLVADTPTTVTHFHSRAAPNIDIHSYLTRILKFAPFSNEVLLSLLVYFDRIAKFKKAKYAVNSLTVHRLLITSIVVASKFTSDIFFPNTRYAKVGGLPLCELNQLELEFLFLCNFDLHVNLEDMQAYGDQLLTHALTQQQYTLAYNNYSFKITSSSTLSPSPPPSSPESATSPTALHVINATSTATTEELAVALPNRKKRKHIDQESDSDSDNNICDNRMKKSEALLDKALVGAKSAAASKSSLLCGKIYSTCSSHRLDTILSSYTHDV